MQTLKQVLKREEERLNLLNMSMCIAIVIAAILLIFGLWAINFSGSINPLDSPHPSNVQTQD